ncbi:MAG TPA: flagellar FlbD family protein [Acidimicrobiales bacterium]|nr:flagellar FlbD family protein [Acidimicrobiales bacterium]
MILLTRFHSGERFAVNPDLIERIEETPDTVITLTNGSKHVVQECIDEITQEMQVFKATTLALATRIAGDPEMETTAHLRIVHGLGDDGTETPPSGDPESTDPS